MWDTKHCAMGVILFYFAVKLAVLIMCKLYMVCHYFLVCFH